MNGLDSSFEALAFIPVNLSPLLSAVAHNIWAWLALFAAAFSFWRICALFLRTTSSHVPLSPPLQRKELTKPVFSCSKTTSFEGIEEEEEDEEDDEVEEQKKGVVGVGLTRGNSSNKFFTVYYEEIQSRHDDDDHVEDDDEDKADVDDDDDDDDDEMDGGDASAAVDDDDEKKNNVGSRSVVIKRWGSTGSTVEMRRSSSFSSSSSSSSSSGEYDMGWYSYQDRKVINGSVVRLWQEERENNGVCVSSPRNCRRSCLVGLTTSLA